MLAIAAMPIAPATVVPLRPPPPTIAVLGFAPPTAAKEASPLPGVAKPVEERRFRILSATEPGEEGVIGVMAAETVTVGGGAGGGGAAGAAAPADMDVRRLRILSATAPGEASAIGVMEGETVTVGGGRGADGGPAAAVADMSPEKWTMHLAVLAGFGSHYHGREMTHYGFGIRGALHICNCFDLFTSHHRSVLSLSTFHLHIFSVFGLLRSNGDGVKHAARGSNYKGLCSRIQRPHGSMST